MNQSSTANSSPCTPSSGEITLKSPKTLNGWAQRPELLNGIPVIEVQEYLTETTIMDRFEIIDFIDKGSYGQVLSVEDLESPLQPLVAKVMISNSEFLEEVSAQQSIFEAAFSEEAEWAQESCPIPRIVNHGYFFQPTQKIKDVYGEDFSLREYKKAKQILHLSMGQLRKIGKVNPYIIMPRYKMNLADYLHQQSFDLTVATVLDIGCRLVKQLKFVHNAGYVYNDLKPDNIMLQTAPKSKQKDLTSQLQGTSLHLIDFGFCTPFKDMKNKCLFERTVLEKFKGNLRYSSADQLGFYSTSRRDDLISLTYILVYLLNKGKFLDSDESNKDLREMSPLRKMEWARNKKRGMTVGTLCAGKAQVVLPFAEKVFALRFYDKPNYDELTKLLTISTEISTRRSKRSRMTRPERQRKLFNSLNPKDAEAIELPQAKPLLITRNSRNEMILKANFKSTATAMSTKNEPSLPTFEAQNRQKVPKQSYLPSPSRKFQSAKHVIKTTVPSRPSFPGRKPISPQRPQVRRTLLTTSRNAPPSTAAKPKIS